MGGLRYIQYSSPAPDNMYAAGSLILISGKGHIKCINGVGGNKRYAAHNIYYQQCVIEVIMVSKLYDITDSYFLERNVYSEGADTFITDHEFIEIFHSGPGGSTAFR